MLDQVKPDRPPDIVATITFKSTADGGRKSPICSGLPNLHEFDGQFNDGVHWYHGVQIVSPGETADTDIYLLAPQYNHGRLYVGMKFLVQDGGRIIGTGKIAKLGDSRLERPQDSPKSG